MLALPHSLLEVHWTKGARRRADDDIGCGDGLFVGIEPGELPFLRDIHAILLLGLEAFQTDRKLVFKQVRDGDELQVAVRRQRLTRRTCAASTAADEGELEFITARHV